MSESERRPEGSGSGNVRALGFVVLMIMVSAAVAMIARGRPASSPATSRRAREAHHIGSLGGEPGRIAAARSDDRPEVRFEPGAVTTAGDDLRVAGTLSNTGAVAVDAPKVVAVFRDARGGELARRDDVWPLPLAVGETTAARLTFDEPPADYAGVDYVVFARERASVPVATELTASGVEAHRDGDSMIVTGRVTNRGSEPAHWVTAVVAGRRGDEILLVERVAIATDPLAPGQSAPFSVRLYGPDVPPGTDFSATVHGR